MGVFGRRRRDNQLYPKVREISVEEEVAKRLGDFDAAEALRNRNYGNCRRCTAEVNWQTGEKTVVCTGCGLEQSTETVGVL